MGRWREVREPPPVWTADMAHRLYGIGFTGKAKTCTTQRPSLAFFSQCLPERNIYNTGLYQEGAGIGRPAHRGNGLRVNHAFD